MKSIHKLFSAGLALVISAGLLAGCSANPGDSSAGTTAASSAGTTASSSAGTAASSSAGTAASTSAGDLKTVRIGGITNELMDSAAVAKKLGYFEEELAKAGYKPEYSAFAQAGPALNEALATNSIDFGIYADFPQLVLRDKGIDVRAIAPVTTAQQYGVIVHADSGIKTARDLEGKKIIVGTGTILQKIFDDWVAADGADADKINQLNALADAQSVFVSGEADAVLSTALGIEVYKAAAPGSEVIFSTGDKPEWATVGTIAGRGDYLDQNPEAAKAIVRALYRAYQYAAADPEKAYEALSSDRAPAQLMKAVYSFDPSFSYFKPEFTAEALDRIGQTNDFLFEQKLISAKVDLTQFVDTQYYDAVKGEFEK